MLTTVTSATRGAFRTVVGTTKTSATFLTATKTTTTTATAKCFMSTKVTVLGAGGGIGQPLSMLLKLSPHIDELACYDIVGTPGVAADLSHVSAYNECKVYTLNQNQKAARQRRRSFCGGVRLISLPARANEL